MITTEARQNFEQAVISAMLLFSTDEAAEFASAELSGEEFTHIGYRAMFRAIVSMVRGGIPIDAVTVAEQLIKRGDFELVGGAAGVGAAFESEGHAEHIRYYVQKVKEQHQRDKVKSLCERFTAKAEDPTEDFAESISETLQELEGIRAGNLRRSELVSAAEALEAYDRRSDSPREVVPTGIGELDRQALGGVRNGQLVVIGGRPGLGKSALMAQLILNAAKEHRPGLIASLEMSPGEIAGRGIQSIPRSRFAELPVWFAECSEFSKLAAVLRLAKRRHNIELAAVDYLQLIESPAGKNDLRERTVAAMSRGLKRLAMELQIPILLGSQLNRDSEKRGRPCLADLRESGAIEQDADIVILISGNPESDERELIVAKHRGGPCGVVQTTFDRPRFVFEDAGPWTGGL